MWKWEYSGPTFPQLHLHHQSPEVCLLTNDVGQPSNVGGIPPSPLHNMWGYHGHGKKGSFRCEYKHTSSGAAREEQAVFKTSTGKGALIAIWNVIVGVQIPLYQCFCSLCGMTSVNCRLIFLSHLHCIPTQQRYQSTPWNAPSMVFQTIWTLSTTYMSLGSWHKLASGDSTHCTVLPV